MKSIFPLNCVQAYSSFIQDQPVHKVHSCWHPIIHFLDNVSLRQRRQTFRVDWIVIEMKLIHASRNNVEQRASKAEDDFQP